jgi:hypothetical protein
MAKRGHRSPYGPPEPPRTLLLEEILDERPRERPSSDPQLEARSRNDRPGIDGDRADFFDYWRANRSDDWGMSTYP